MLGELHEIILYVDDMETQIEFYRDILDLDLGNPTDAEDWSTVHWAEFETGRCSLCLHSGGTDQQVEGASKIVFWVDDVSEACQWLDDRGVQTGDIRSPSPGLEVADAHDPEGNVFSIEGRAE